jgi:hypothetical protein
MGLAANLPRACKECDRGTISNLGSLDALSESLQRAVREATLAADERILALRLSLCGRSALHGRLVQNPEQMRAQLRAWVNEASGGLAWLEKVEIAVAAPLDLQSLALRDDPFGLLLRRLDEISGDEALLAQFAQSQLAELAQKLPPEFKERGSALNPLAPAFCAQALAAARERLLAAISLEAAP